MMRPLRPWAGGCPALRRAARPWRCCLSPAGRRAYLLQFPRGGAIGPEPRRGPPEPAAGWGPEDKIEARRKMPIREGNGSG